MKLILVLFATVLFYSCTDSDSDGGHEGHDTSQANSENQKMTQLALIMHHMEAEMQNALVTGSPDLDFANLMRIHHQSAVEMADIANAQGKDPEVKQLAGQMKMDQQKEIASFDSVLNADVKGDSSEKFINAFKASIKAMDHGAYKQEASIDKEFLQLMIPHHQGAIDMAKAYLPYSKNPRLKKIAQNILSSQQKEIETMKGLQEKLKN